MHSFTDLPKDNLKEILENPLTENPNNFANIVTICKSWNLAAKSLRTRCLQNKELDAFFLSVKKELQILKPSDHRVFINWANKRSPSLVAQLEELAQHNPFAQFTLFKIYAGQFFQFNLNPADTVNSLFFISITPNFFKAYLHLNKAAATLSQAKNILDQFHKILISSDSNNPYIKVKENFLSAIQKEIESDSKHREFAEDLLETFYSKPEYISKSQITLTIHSG